MSRTVLAVDDLWLSRHSTDGLSRERRYQVSLPQLQLHAGDIVAVTGPSGCGKSTLMEALGLMLSPERVTSYVLGGEDVTPWLQGTDVQADWQRGRLRSHYLGIVPQTGGLLPYLTVQQNIALQAQMLGQRFDHGWLAHMVERLGLTGLLSHLPRDLSVGQRQRTSFLRALAHQPCVLLADEPTAALDPVQAEQLFRLMLEVAREAQIAVLVVTHEWDLVETLGLRRLHAEPLSGAHTRFVI